MAVGANGKQMRGLACVSPEKRREIARKGQKAARSRGLCYKFDHETAVRAGHIAGSLKRYPYERPKKKKNLASVTEVREAIQAGETADLRTSLEAEMHLIDQIEAQARALELPEEAQLIERIRETRGTVCPSPEVFEFPEERRARERAEIQERLVAQQAAALPAPAPGPAKLSPEQMGTMALMRLGLLGRRR